MTESQITFITAGYGANGNWHYSIGNGNEPNLENRQINVGHNGTGDWSTVMSSMFRPWPGVTPDTSIGWATGSTTAKGWAYMVAETTPGFRGVIVNSERYNITTPVANPTITIPANPMDRPGGIVWIAFRKHDNAGYWPYIVINSPGWVSGAWGYYVTSAFYPLSLTHIEDPPNVQIKSDQDSGAANWAGMIAFIR